VTHAIEIKLKKEGKNNVNVINRTSVDLNAKFIKIISVRSVLIGSRGRMKTVLKKKKKGRGGGSE